MCFEIGNKVAVIDDKIEGIVIDIVEEEVYIEDSDGLKYRYHKSDLIKANVKKTDLDSEFHFNGLSWNEKYQKNREKRKLFVKSKNEVVLEIDLHIEKLVHSNKKINKIDILDYQIQIAREKIEYCIQKRINKIVFIHGVGEGILKSELYFLLDCYPVDYYDASYQKYGLGATEVYIYQNTN